MPCCGTRLPAWTPATSPPAIGVGAVSRREAIAGLVKESFWKELDERFHVVVQPFLAGGWPGRHRTCTGRWPRAPAKYKNLVGVVLVSDGDWNAGLPPVEAATLLRLKGVPVFAVPVGSPTRLPDVELLEPGRADLRRPRQVGAHPLHRRELAAARLRDHRGAAHLAGRRGHQGGPHCGHGRHPRLDRVEAGGDRRRDVDAGESRRTATKR